MCTNVLRLLAVYTNRALELHYCCRVSAAYVDDLTAMIMSMRYELANTWTMYRYIHVIIIKNTAIFS